VFKKKMDFGVFCLLFVALVFSICSLLECIRRRLCSNPSLCQELGWLALEK
jgi:hypothetical protein